MKATETPVRYKSFVYHTSCEWLGRRIIRFEAPGKPPMLISSPPEFKGEAGFWTPEEMFVGAVESCFLMTFAARVLRHELPVEAYYSEAIGQLEFSEGAYRITKVTIKPIVIVTGIEAVEPVQRALDSSLHECFVGRSIRSEVELKPDVQVSRP